MRKPLLWVALLFACVGGVLLGGLAAPMLHPSRPVQPAFEPWAASGAAAGSVAGALAGALAGPGVGVVSAAPPPSTKPVRTIQWDALVPEGWDPLKPYKGMKLDALSDSDPRAVELLKRMRESWNNAPTNNALNDQRVRIAGYIVPLDEDAGGLIRFLLVPYYGACIHTPPPPSNQIIDVTPAKAHALRMMDAVWVTGTLRAMHSDTVLGATGYQLQATDIEPYTAPKDDTGGGSR